MSDGGFYPGAKLRRRLAPAQHHLVLAVFGAMAQNGQLTAKMLERMKKGSNMPGWTRRSEFDWFATLADREA